MRLTLRPRLLTAADMLSGMNCVADIGADHGRLPLFMLQNGLCQSCILTDISAGSIEKARLLAARIGMADRLSFRVGDGLSVLRSNEADAIALLGMGGTLMAQILDADKEQTGEQTFYAVFQPMRAYADIRAYLHREQWHIMDDRVIEDNGRLYQIFKAKKGVDIQQAPAHWPADFYDLGFTAYLQRDPLLPALAEKMLRQAEKRLMTAEGSRGEARLQYKRKCLLQILEITGGSHEIKTHT